MKAQALGDASSMEFMRGRRILEINTEHPIIKDLRVSYLIVLLVVVGLSICFGIAIKCLLQALDKHMVPCT